MDMAAADQGSMAMGLGATVSMWSIMCIAMMFPSALPMVFSFSKVTRQLSSHSPSIPVAIFLLTYLGVWAAFGVFAGTTEWLLDQHGFVHSGKLQNRNAAGFLLILVGLYQWSSFKNFCLSKCKSPLGFLLEHYRSGCSGALRVGVAHAIFCLGCCWAVMLLGWVGGAMNLFWMLAITILVSAEKLLGIGHRLARASAIAFFGMGICEIASGLSLA
jgi:predicted metal-binding membrane protein